MRKIDGYYLARTAVVTGDVTIAADASIWYGAVVRGDVAPVRIGARTNVQDGAVLHCRTGVPLDVADEVIIGHHAVVHGRRVGRRSLIGIRATLLDDVEVGEHCLIAAGSLLVPGTTVPDGSVVMGSPGRVVREIRDEDRAYIEHAVRTYLDLAARYAAGEFRECGVP